jgi:hypothetical protein
VTSQFDLTSLTEEQRQHLLDFLTAFSKLEGEILEAIPPAKMKLLRRALSDIIDTGGYGSIELVIAQNKVQNINIRKSLR